MKGAIEVLCEASWVRKRQGWNRLQIYRLYVKTPHWIQEEFDGDRLERGEAVYFSFLLCFI